MRCLALLPVIDGIDDAATHEARPDAVGGDLSEALVLRRGDHGGEPVARVLRIVGERGGGLVTKLGEGPFGLHLGAGLEGHGDERFARQGLEAVHVHTARERQFDFLAAKHGRELEQILLHGFVRG